MVNVRVGSWNTSYLAEIYHWYFQSTKTERLFIFGRHGRGRPEELWNRGPLECDHPKDSPLLGLTLWELHRNLPWQRKQPLLRWTFIKIEPGRARTRTQTHTQTLVVNPAKTQLSVTSLVGFLENLSLSSPFDPQNVLSIPCTGQPCQHSVRLTLVLSYFSKSKHVHYLLSLMSAFLQLSASKQGISKLSWMFMYECNQLVPRSHVSRGHN